MNDEAKPAAGDQTRQTPDLFLDLIHEVIDRPEVADRLPDAGQVELSSIDLHGHAYLLAAFKPPDNEVWTAHIVRYTLTAGAPSFRRPVLDDRSEVHDQAAIVRSLTAIGATAKDALDALELDLRTRIDQALGIPTTGSRATV